MGGGADMNFMLHADMNRNGALEMSDLFAWLAEYFAGSRVAQAARGAVAGEVFPLALVVRGRMSPLTSSYSGQWRTDSRVSLIVVKR